MWEGNKIHDFCPRDIESCHHAASRLVKVWSLNANLFRSLMNLTSWLNSLNGSI